MLKKNSLLEAATYVTLQKQSASEELGITQEYDRSNYDNQYAHAKFKDRAFENKQGEINKTAIDENGKLVYRYKDDAKARFGEQKGELAVADADHIDALKSIHNRHKHNPFLSDSDIKEIGNRTGNFQLMRASENRSKQESSDFIEGIKDGNIKKATKGLKTQIETDLLLTQRTAQNMGTEFATGAMDTVAGSAIPLTIEATKQFMLVVQGEKSLEDAAKDVGKDTFDTAVKGGTNKLVVDVATVQLANSKNAVLKDIAKNNQVAELIVAAKIVSDSAMRYINNEIDGERFIDEVKENAAMLLAGKIGTELGGMAGAVAGATIGSTLLPFIGTKLGEQLGTAVGRIVGGMVATMAVGMVCSTINDIKGAYKSIGKREQAYLDMLDEIYQEATAEMNRQRELLKVEFEKKQIKWTAAIEQGFDTMISGACADSFDDVTAGLDQVLDLFNTEARFHSADEVRSFLNTPDRVFVL